MPREHKTNENGLKRLSPVPAKKAATAKIGNSDALVKPPLVIAKTHFIKIVENLIGILTSSSIGTVIPQ